MKTKQIPSHLPCPKCDSPAIVLPVIIHLEDGEIIPLVCPHCVDMFAIVEKKEGVLGVHSMSLDGKERMLDILEGKEGKKILPISRSRPNWFIVKAAKPFPLRPPC